MTKILIDENLIWDCVQVLEKLINGTDPIEPSFFGEAGTLLDDLKEAHPNPEG